MSAAAACEPVGVTPSWGWTLAVLSSRLVGFAIVQAAVAGWYALTGERAPWQRSLLVAPQCDRHEPGGDRAARLASALRGLALPRPATRGAPHHRARRVAGRRRHGGRRHAGRGPERGLVAAQRLLKRDGRPPARPMQRYWQRPMMVARVPPRRPALGDRRVARGGEHRLRVHSLERGAARGAGAGLRRALRVGLRARRGERRIGGGARPRGGPTGRSGASHSPSRRARNTRTALRRLAACVEVRSEVCEARRESGRVRAVGRPAPAPGGRRARLSRRRAAEPKTGGGCSDGSCGCSGGDGARRPR